MKDSLIIACGLFLVLGIGMWSFFRSQETVSQERSQQKTAIQIADDFQKISSEELQSIILDKIKSEKVIIIDTRPASLWSEEHMIGSKNLPYEEADQSFSPIDTERSRTWIVMSPDIASAGRFATLLRSREIPVEHIKIFNGTYETWKEKTGLITKRADPSSPVDVTKITLIPLETAAKKIEQIKQWFLLDIRAPQNFAKDHIAGAVNIPFSELEEKRWTIPKTTPVFVYGENDRESFAGGVLLFDLGFFETITLSAGFDEWKAKNLPTSK